MSGRKYIRIALSESDHAKMLEAKEKAENSIGVSLSESLFALSLIRQAISKN